MPLENRLRLPRIPLSKRNRAVVRALNPMLVTYLEASRDLCEADSILFGAGLAVCRLLAPNFPWLDVLLNKVECRNPRAELSGIPLQCRRLRAGVTSRYALMSQYAAGIVDSENTAFEDSQVECSATEDEQPQSSALLQVEQDLASLNVPGPSQGQRARERPSVPWSNTNEGMKIFDFTEKVGLKVTVSSESKAIDFLSLFLDDEFLTYIVLETNKHAADVLMKPGVGLKSRITDWKDTSVAEMKLFFGIILHMGIIRLNRLTDYWKKDRLFNIPIFRQYMSRNRFLLLFRCLHFSSSSLGGLSKVDELIKRFNDKMNDLICAQKELSLDESMILYRGRLLFRQYIKTRSTNMG
ncbi:unnamed protein product [Parnassius apollo]|uniref:(apollo) hypothetical protein n=1 Tax=Parnassius apollo TaxID=110799 RepID=A0A8S3XL06_PARAO|nr:unnamed protein product [Parnassius apollo]